MILRTALSIVILAFFMGSAQQDLEPWEKLGISKTEWKMIHDNKMPMGQVEDLLKAGIGISEYFKRPWEELGLTESKWIEKKRSGMSNYDIELEAKSSNAEWKTEMKDAFHSEMSSMPENLESLSAFLPGFQQYKNGKNVKGTFMVSIAATAVTWCVAGSARNKNFYALPLFTILLPDMIWSFVDYKVMKRQNKH